MILAKAPLAFPGFLFFLLTAAVVWCVAKMIESNRNDVLVSAPLIPEQEVRLSYTGMVRVVLEAPRTSGDFRHLRIELTDRQTGQSVTASYSLLPAQAAVYGVTTMQVPFGPATSMSAGVYTARIGGLHTGADYSRYRLTISRPYIGRLTLQIIGLVLCGTAMLLDVVWFAWLAR